MTTEEKEKIERLAAKKLENFLEDKYYSHIQEMLYSKAWMSAIYWVLENYELEENLDERTRKFIQKLQLKVNKSLT
jgi:uncharacterized protein (DUF1697 family)